MPEPASAAQPGAPEPAGELLAGRYRVNGLLGRGGMSEVYHGYDKQLDRRVAIKVLRPPAAVLSNGVPAGPSSPEAVEILDGMERDRKRFLREIQVMAKLELPGIPAVYDTGTETAPDGTRRLWLVMQLLRGSTLEAILDRTGYGSSPPAVTWAAAIAAQVAAVLADVHQVDIVHRDIKPANVMVTGGGIVKVLDFGIAILQGAGALPRLTQVGRTIGTPPYMSPEQCLGQAVTSASDVYSLGCLFLELLTGDVPFFATTDTPLRTHHLSTPAPPARRRRSDVPDALSDLTAAMLAKEPAARPSAMEVYEALLPFTGRGGDAPDRAADAADTSGTSGASGADEDNDPTRPFRRPLLTRAAVQREPDAANRTPLSEAEARLLENSAAALLDSDHPSQAIALLEDGVARTAHEPALRLQLRHSLGGALFAAGEYTRAAAVLSAVGRDYQHYRFPPNDRFVLECAYHAGMAYAETGKAAKALPQLRFYVQNAQPGADDPDSGSDSGSDDNARQILEARFVIAQMLAAEGESDEALAELRAVRPLLVDAYGEQSTFVRNLDKQSGRLGRDSTLDG
jgi:serine/threonine protein kinase